ncbi:hypothetical protein DTL21_00060 [Bremerella cremea]|uniref:Uncharacterized protein n=1 Tax=Blastopirellula marina TaxID=124 RepID=A0A2S8G7X1_9BACT|nr:MULTISPECIES: hypothetical protein [Pirellulaceae]PQO40371.1 hypothetical protein C5Y83_00060 [Blastopirellula marina]RCS51953.1 hypothetical protein DTL21_00060 [Bremerella cremea]
MNRTNTLSCIALILVTLAIGCDEDELLELAKRHNLSEAERSRLMAELHGKVAEGSSEMVASDAVARKELVTLHREVQAERAEFGKQRDALELDRKEIAAERKRDSLTASAILSLGTLAGCLAPLAICWYLLRSPLGESNDSEVAELLLSDVIAAQPVLLNRPETNPPKLTHQIEPSIQEE